MIHLGLIFSREKKLVEDILIDFSSDNRVYPIVEFPEYKLRFGIKLKHIHDKITYSKVKFFILGMENNLKFIYYLFI